MAKVRLIGHKRLLDDTLALLHRLGVVHVIDIGDDSGAQVPPLAIDEPHLHEAEDLRYLRTRLDGLLGLTEHAPAPSAELVEFDAAALVRLREELDAEGPDFEALVRRLDDLERERETLPRYIGTLRRLLPLVPELTALESYETAALLVERRHADLLGDLNVAIAEVVGANYDIISDNVDADTVGAILVFPRRHATEVQALLGRGQLSRVHLPERFRDMPFRGAIAEMERRVVAVPDEIENVRDQIDAALRRHQDWVDASRWLAGRLDQLAIIRSLGATSHTFVLSGWTPRPEVDRLRTAVAGELGDAVVVEVSDPSPDESPPVLLANPAPVRPFEFLVKLLAIPRYGSRDPTGLMMLFLPLFFGMMLGDVAYGAALLTVMALVYHRYRLRPGGIRDLSRILMIAAAWTIVWGVIYAEFLGDLGHRLWGWEPLWINREEALEPLLIFAIAIGGAHVALGLLLGVFDAARQGRRHLLAERLATLVALAGLFLIAGVAADQAPQGLLTPAVAAVAVGLVVLMALGGAIGALMGPLELLGTIGNVLSYLRIAAIGLASVYLARVANELGAAAPIWLGILIAALFHALNLALGTFSPTIQALRLHYVEFFGKFYDEGGRAYRPFGASDDHHLGSPVG